MSITAAQLHILQHAQGLDEHGRGSRYRNHFTTGPDSDDWKDCVALVDAGLMKSHGERAIAGGMTVFSVTEAGDQVVREQSPKPTKVSRSKDRYRQWLWSRCDMPFGEWLKTGGCR